MLPFIGRWRFGLKQGGHVHRVHVPSLGGNMYDYVHLCIQIINSKQHIFHLPILVMETITIPLITKEGYGRQWRRFGKSLPGDQRFSQRLNKAQVVCLARGQENKSLTILSRLMNTLSCPDLRTLETFWLIFIDWCIWSTWRSYRFYVLDAVDHHQPHSQILAMTLGVFWQSFLLHSEIQFNSTQRVSSTFLYFRCYHIYNIQNVMSGKLWLLNVIHLLIAMQYKRWLGEVLNQSADNLKGCIRLIRYYISCISRGFCSAAHGLHSHVLHNRRETY